MKINPFSGLMELPTRISRKQEADGHAREERKQHEEAPQKDDHLHIPLTAPLTAPLAAPLAVPLTANDEKVEEALKTFQNELHVSSQELQASLTSSELGLKVVLKDGSGAIVRQFSGEEFLKMREAAQKLSSNRGKILDQKL